MFCAFEGRPSILELPGTGRVVAEVDPEFLDLATAFVGSRFGQRAVVVVDVHCVADSCGYRVPEMALVGERPVLELFSRQRGLDGLREYREEHNRASIDGLPALP